MKYDGKPEHKRHAGDFDLHPPCSPRSGKSFCDEAGIRNRSTAQRLLKLAFEKGFVDSRNKESDWPRHVWAVYEGCVFEGKPSGAYATYHGYPLQSCAPFFDRILKAWSSR